MTFAGSLACFLDARPCWLRTQRLLVGTVLGALAVQPAVRRTPAATSP